MIIIKQKFGFHNFAERWCSAEHRLRTSELNGPATLWKRLKTIEIESKSNLSQQQVEIIIEYFRIFYLTNKKRWQRASLSVTLTEDEEQSRGKLPSRWREISLAGPMARASEHRRHPKLKLFLPSARAYGLFVKGPLHSEISRPLLSVSSFGSSSGRSKTKQNGHREWERVRESEREDES